MPAASQKKKKIKVKYSLTPIPDTWDIQAIAFLSPSMALHVSVEAWFGKSFLFVAVSDGGHRLSLTPEFWPCRCREAVHGKCSCTYLNRQSMI